MPYTPDAWTREDQCCAIGGLCGDVATAVQTQYGQSQSIADAEDTALALKTVFEYAQAVQFVDSHHAIASDFTDMVNPNLDARCPVILGIRGKPGGHAILVDGYGYEASISYYHLNLGWSGSCDAWYNLPTIDTGPYLFEVVQKCVYNVFPSRTGEIISGRVLNAWAMPIAGADVTGVDSYGITYTAKTDERGIYALVGVSSETGLQLRADHPSYIFPEGVPVTVGRSADGGACGNRWQIDIVGIYRQNDPETPLILVDPPVEMPSQSDPETPLILEDPPVEMPSQDGPNTPLLILDSTES